MTDVPFGSNRGEKPDKFHLPSFEEKKNSSFEVFWVHQREKLNKWSCSKNFLNLEILREAVNY